MQTTSHVSDRRPNNLGDAPELLTLVQAAHAMGMSIKNIKKLEASDPAFPRRQRVPFSKVDKFRRFELQRWFTDHLGSTPEEVGA